MYLDFFGLQCRPFELTPDSRFLFPSSQHARAIANIRFALLNNDSFVIITGEIGVGKTTVLNKVLSELGRDTTIARLTHTTLTPIELLQALLSEFGLRQYKSKKVRLINELRDFLVAESEAGRQVVIMIDEAQNLSKQVLEELRLISCIETETRKIVQVVLMGQPELNELINSRELKQLRQRTRLRQHIAALDETETVAYLHHRIDVAGGDYRAIFEDDVAPLVYRHTGGIPRLINTLCDTALTGCMVEEESRVTRAMIEKVVAELGWDGTERSGPVPARQAAHPAAPNAWLFVHRSGQLIARIAVGATPLTIGRHKANDVHVDDRYLSRRHALIAFEDGQFQVEDLKSLNGTVLNKSYITRHALLSGDEIVIGSHHFTFYLDDDVPVNLADTQVLPADEKDDEASAGRDDTPTVQPTGARARS